MDALEAAVRRVLRYSHPPDVAEACDVQRSTAYRWKKGGELAPFRITQLAELFGLTEQTESAPPELAGRLGAIWALLVAMAPASKVSPAVIKRIEAAHRIAAGLAPEPPQSVSQRQKATRRPPDK